MTMAEVEADVLRDLRELGDEMSCYAYLIGCAREERGYPEELRREQYRIKDCQGMTWAAAHWESGRLYFRGDSDSLIVKGALAILEELYDGRTRREIDGCRVCLLQDEAFIRFFTPEQARGLHAVLAVIQAARPVGSALPRREG